MTSDPPKFTVRPLSKQPRSDLKDSFRIHLSASSLLQTKLRAGDLCQIQIASNNNGDSGGVSDAPKTAIAWSAAEKIQDTVVQTSKLLQELYGFKLGDKVHITKETEPLAEVAVVYLEESTSREQLGDIADADKAHWEWSLEYPLSKTEIVAVGMTFEHDLKGCRRSFRIAGIETAAGAGTNSIAQFRTSSKTKIGQPQGNQEHMQTALEVDTAGVGGLSAQIGHINERLRDFTLESKGVVMPSFYRNSGGILVHGPKGTGKSVLLSKIEAAGWKKVFRLNSSVIGRAVGDSEATLRKTFADALRYQPSLIAIDQLDFIAPKRGSGDTSSSVASSLCEGLDSLQNNQILVVACSRRPNDVDDSLRTPHRLGVEIELPVPTANSRKEILYALRGTDTEPGDALLEDMAARTHGYVGADLFSLLQLACRKALTRQLSSLTVDDASPRVTNGEAGQETKETVPVRILETDVTQALQETRPTAMREVFLETPMVKWTDIGGQHGIKKRLRKAVERPIKHPERLKRFNVSGKKGVLLYGPPGCSKTLLVKALATEAGLNFLAIKGAEILSMYVGESERSLRDIFRKARAASPSIIFFDEIDAIATKRGDPGAHAGLNVLTTLLNEMDGIEELKNVLVIAATNKPDVLDPALMRPGRLDHLLYVGPPDLEARKELLDIWFDKADVDDEVDPLVLASLMEGHSGAEIVSICEAAADAALDEEEETDERQQIELRHFDLGMAQVPKQITPAVLMEYQHWKEDFASNL